MPGKKLSKQEVWKKECLEKKCPEKEPRRKELPERKLPERKLPERKLLEKEQQAKYMELITQALLDMGEAMMACGAEVHRVEDTLTRIAKAYQVQSINVFVITSNITLTISSAQIPSCTQTRRILKQESTDFSKLEELNALSRAFCAHPTPPEHMINEILEIMKKQPNPLYYCLGSVLSASGFTLFFGGSLPDALAAGLAGLLVCYLKKHLAPFCMNLVTFHLFSSFLTGIAIFLSTRLLPVLHLDKVTMGVIMLLIPGIAMTNAVRDIILGDTISGSMRLMETLLWALSLSCGFMASLWLMNNLLR